MLHTIVLIVLLSFVPQIIIQHFIFLYHSKFLSKRVFLISRDVDDRMGEKSKPQKESLDKKLKPKKILYRTAHHQDYSVKIKPTKNTCPIFPTPKESQNLKFQTQKILRSSLSLEIRSTSTGVSFHPKFLNRKFCL